MRLPSKVEPIDCHTVELTATCVACGEDTTFEANAQGYKRWEKGECIQVALPSVAPENRELLISGMCGTCWDSLFPDPEDDPDELLDR